MKTVEALLEQVGTIRRTLEALPPEIQPTSFTVSIVDIAGPEDRGNIVRDAFLRTSLRDRFMIELRSNLVITLQPIPLHTTTP